MEGLERFSDWMQSDGLEMARLWYGAVVQEARHAPLSAIAIVVMPLLVGLLARSLATLAGAAVFSVATLTATTTSFPEEIHMVIATAALAAFALFCFHGALEHRRHLMMRRAIAGLQKKNAETQALLDREIQWRMAAEPLPTVRPEAERPAPALVAAE